MNDIFLGYPSPKIRQFIEEHYNPLNKPLTFTATGDSSVQLTKVNSPADISLEYSLDGFKTDPIPYTISAEINLTDGQSVSMRAVSTNDTLGSSWSNYYKFVMSGSIAASGNIQSLLDKTCQRMDVPEWCYAGIFTGCTSLTTAPELPATTLANGCYYYMFSHCRSLTQAPELPVTTLADGCYQYMFYACKSLTQAPELPATTLADGCYYNMFSGCSALTQAPELPATTLADRCYYDMFSNCTSLTTAPELPATTLANDCYNYMFNNCKSLIQAPELPATTLADGCYYCMFKQCSTLETASFPNLSRANVKSYTTTQSTFEEAASNIEATCQDGILVINSTPLTFTATGNSSVQLTKQGSPANISLEYSFDGFKTDPIPYTIGNTISLSDGQSVSMRAISTNDTIGSSWSNYYKFVMSGRIAASGNIQSLLDKTCQRMDVPAYCYYNMFSNCSALTQAPKILPATILATWCYASMFYNCRSLTTAPKLPATTLTGSCYAEMFFNCTSLTQAPELPATTLASNCYHIMFKGCTSLTQAPKILPATILATQCYWNMFQNCSALTEAPELPATTLADNCYSAMFSGCTSLTQAPELPATTLADNCYSSMFYNCTSLTQAPELPATTLADYCYSGMFYDCTSLTQASELPATTLANWCYSNMFCNCRSLTQAPELPATTLATQCYYNMFNGCSALTQAPSIAKLDNSSCYYMFYDANKLEEITFTDMTTTEVANVAYTACIGIPNMQLVVCWCTDGVVVINDKSDSSDGSNS